MAMEQKRHFDPQGLVKIVESAYQMTWQASSEDDQSESSETTRQTHSPLSGEDIVRSCMATCKMPKVNKSCLSKIWLLE